MPIPLLGLDTDNGGEFLNHLLIDYCAKESITFTRSRAYKKNDQCYVEEKNGSVVRKFIGYERFEGFAACRVLARLYESLRLYVNFFQPSMKLVSKERFGGKTKKKYDKAQTPCQRIIASDTVKNKVKMLLRRQFKQLDPVKLLEQIHRLQDELWSLAGEPAITNQQRRTSAELVLVSIHMDKMSTSEKIKVIPFTGEKSLDVKEKSSDRSFRKAKRIGRYHRVKHTWRTRVDPFAGVWQEVEAQLREHPHLEAKRLFRNLQTRYPERFKEGQLRTMQRRVKAWRLRYARLVAEEVHLVLSRNAETITNTPQFQEPLDLYNHNPYKFQYKVMTGVPYWSG